LWARRSCVRAIAGVRLRQTAPWCVEQTLPHPRQIADFGIHARHPILAGDKDRL
jgi:hypothetical protein